MMFQEQGINKEDVLETLRKFLNNNTTYHSGHPIDSMSTTPHPLSQEIFLKLIE